MTEPSLDVRLIRLLLSFVWFWYKMGKNSVGGYKHFIAFHLQFCFNVTKVKKIKKKKNQQVPQQQQHAGNGG